MDKLEKMLNNQNKEQRLIALKKLMDLESTVKNFSPQRMDVNNHIHTIYSFSPYSPSAAVYNSLAAGLVTTGIMDHDSVSGAEEFLAAGKICNMPVTVGAELRVSFAGTSLEGKMINNPDQDTVAYVAMHGIPHSKLQNVRDFFVPISDAREKRNKAMVSRINEITKSDGIILDYERDVLPISYRHEGGSVTERHLLFALSGKIIEKFGKGKTLIEYLTKTLNIDVSGKNLDYLLDTESDIYQYDLLNVLKGNMVQKFYIRTTDETVPVANVAKFADENGIILAYAYLGDVTQSATGDKKAQKFEDDYLDEVFKVISKLGFKAVTYMPSRNTPAQLKRLRALCNEYGLFQISGEDINQPRQKFVCEAMREEGFSNLYDSAWALIGHELMGTEDINNGMFSSSTIAKMPNLEERIKYYKKNAMEKYNK